MATGAEPISDLRNLGPRSREWLAAVGIHTIADLRAAGAVPAYVALRSARGGVSLNLLYALVGALEGMHWQDVRRTRRLELALQVEDCERRRDRRGSGRRPQRSP
jgi:DNA transformation protein